MLGIHHRPLLCQTVEAWPYGPMLPEIYRGLHRNSDAPVRRIIDLIYKIRPPGRKAAIGHAPRPGIRPGNGIQRIAVIPGPVIDDYYAGQKERADSAAAARKR